MPLAEDLMALAGKHRGDRCVGGGQERVRSAAGAPDPDKTKLAERRLAEEIQA